MKKTLTSFVKRSDGSAAVEFALVAPVFFTVIFGIIESGYTYLSYNSMQFARDQAARYAMLHPLATSDQIKSQITSHLFNIPAQGLVLTVENQTINSKSYKRIVLSYPVDSVVSGAFGSEQLTLSTETTVPTIP